MGRAVKPNARKASPLKLRERDITRTCNDYLMLRGWRPVRMNAGPFGASGQPDYIMLHYRRKLALWVEYKAGEGRLGEKQVEWIANERRLGALVVVVRDIDEFMVWYDRTFGQEGQQRMQLEMEHAGE